MHVADCGMETLQPMLIGNTDAEFSPAQVPTVLNCSASPQLPKDLTSEQLAAILTAIGYTCPSKEAARVR